MQAAHRVDDRHKVALLGALGTDGMHPVDGPGDRTLDKTRPIGVLVAVNEPDQLDLRLPGTFRVHHETDLLPGLHHEVVRIAGQHGLSHCRRHPFRMPPGFAVRRGRGSPWLER